MGTINFFWIWPSICCKEKSSPVTSVHQGLNSKDWRDRLKVSRELGTGFAAPGGEFTRSLYEWSLSPKGNFILSLLKDRRVVELGAGMMPYGYALAALAGAKNFVAVEPFFADRQEIAQQAYIEQNPSMQRIPRNTEAVDMLSYLESKPDNLLVLLACGIEDCILPGPDYRRKVEGEIGRTLEQDGFFISSHSDLKPQGLRDMEFVFPRPSHPKIFDRLRIHGSNLAYERNAPHLPRRYG